MKQNQASHSGAQGVKGVEEVRKGTTKDRSGGAGGGGGVGKSTGRKGCRDKSHYNINHRPGTERSVWVSLHWRSETSGGE